jgi:hypothetical protein
MAGLVAPNSSNCVLLKPVHQCAAEKLSLSVCGDARMALLLTLNVHMLLECCPL